MFCQALQSDGYAIVPDVLSSTGLESWREATGRFSTAVARNLLADTAVRELVDKPTIRRLVEPFLGKEARPVRGLLFDKRPSDNWSVAWHQDTIIPVSHRPTDAPSGYTKWTEKQGVTHVRPPASVLEEMLAVRLCLDDNERDNGVLRVLPGSHHEGILNQKQVEQYQNRETSYACVARAGDAVLMRPLLLHASSKATSHRSRRVIHLEFSAASLPEPLDWPDWSLRIIPKQSN